MKDMKHDLKSAAVAGGVVGGFLGLVVYLWAAVTHIQPALVQQGGLSTLTADLLTLGLSVFGGMEVSMGLGVLVGLIKALLLYALIYLPVTCCQKYCCSSPEEQYSVSVTPMPNSLKTLAKPRALQVVVVEEPHSEKPSTSSRTAFFAKPDANKPVDSHLHEPQAQPQVIII